MANPLESVHQEISRTQDLIDNGYLIESLKRAEKMLENNSQVPEAHIAWRHIMNKLSMVHVSLGTAYPEALEFGELYEKLQQFGWLSLPAHILALQHYCRRGQLDRAQKIYASLATIAPNHLGLKSMMRKLVLSTETVVPYSIFKGLRDRKELRQRMATSAALTETYVECLELANESIVAEEYEQALELVDTVLKQDPTLCALTAELYFKKAYALTCLSRYAEALPIIYQLASLFPENEKYSEGYANIGEQAFSFAVEAVKVESKPEILSNYYESLFNFFFVPIELLIAVKTTDEREQIRARLFLSPNDTDYLAAALQLSQKLQDNEWNNEIRNKIRDLIKERPYDLKIKSLFGLMARKELS